MSQRKGKAYKTPKRDPTAFIPVQIEKSSIPNYGMKPLASAINTGKNKGKEQQFVLHRTITDQGNYPVKTGKAHSDIDYSEFLGPQEKVPVKTQIDQAVKADFATLPPEYQFAKDMEVMSENAAYYGTPEEEDVNRRRAFIPSGKTMEELEKEKPNLAPKLKEEANKSVNASREFSNNSLGKTLYKFRKNCWIRWCRISGRDYYSKGGSKKIKGGYQTGGDYDEIRQFISKRPYLEQILKGESCPTKISEEEIEDRSVLKQLANNAGIDIEDLSQLLYPDEFVEEADKLVLGGKRGKKTRKAKRRSRKTRKAKRRTKRRN